MSQTSVLPVRIFRDHLYIGAAAFDAHLRNIRSVALLRQKNDLLILPIASAEAGGFFVKQVNANGDRAIHAADFFRLNGIDEMSEHHVEAVWSSSFAGFSVCGFFMKSGVLPQSESKLDLGRSSA
jgi:hypothetical protein